MREVPFSPTNNPHIANTTSQAHPGFFFGWGGGGGADPAGFYNLCLFLKVCYENDVKISEPTSNQVTGKIKAN
jgi:hypothetical protein